VKSKHGKLSHRRPEGLETIGSPLIEADRHVASARQALRREPGEHIAGAHLEKNPTTLPIQSVDGLAETHRLGHLIGQQSLHRLRVISIGRGGGIADHRKPGTLKSVLANMGSKSFSGPSHVRGVEGGCHIQLMGS
jgi:hypothetical protein